MRSHTCDNPFSQGQGRDEEHLRLSPLSWGSNSSLQHGAQMKAPLTLYPVVGAPLGLPGGAGSHPSPSEFCLHLCSC